MYEDEAIGKITEITLGHSKDSWTDLKQFNLSLITNQHGILLFAEAKTGNASDKKTITETIWSIDSATYTESNILRLGNDLKWITRVPATINEAKELLDSDVKMTPYKDLRYSFYSTTSNYGRVSQKWILFHSETIQQKMEKSFQKRFEEEDQRRHRLS